MRLAILALAIIAAVICAGCAEQVATWLGAPSAEEMHEAREAERIALADLATLEAEYADSEDARVVAETIGAEADESLAEARALVDDMITQMADLTGAARATMLAAIERVKLEIAALEEKRAEASATVITYGQKVTALVAAIHETGMRVENASATLRQHEADQDSAIDRAAGSAETVGSLAGELGVPGGAAAGRVAGNLIRTGMEAILGIGGIWAVLRGRKQKVRADGETVRADGEAKRRNWLARIIAATDKFELIKADPTAKAGAKEWAGPDAHAEMDRTLIAMRTATGSAPNVPAAA